MRARLLDTEAEQAFDDITFLAEELCRVPIALVSLVDAERQWFKSRRGLDATETSRDVSFCGHAILDSEALLVVPDATKDPRFADNPLVLGDHAIRFYAGAPIFGQGDLPLGTLCVIDREPRTLSDAQLECLRVLARRVDGLIELRETNRELVEALEALQLVSRVLPMCSSCRNMRDGDAWVPLEQYVQSHPDAEVSRRICPACAEH